MHQNSLRESIKIISKRIKIHRLIVYARYYVFRYFISFTYSAQNVNKKKVSILKVSNHDISFFGYYNISPENQQGEVLYLSTTNEKPRGSKTNVANIFLLQKKGGRSIKIGYTRAWNWQQGCMLQWLPSHYDKIIFNDFDLEERKYVSRIIGKDGRNISKYDKPICVIDKNGKYGYTLNFERLALLRPDYGYFNNNNIKLPDNKDDGIWKIDLENGNSKLIITLNMLKNLNYVYTMDRATHKVNHIDVNSSGNRIIFLHRWISVYGRFMRLIAADNDGTNLYVLNGDKMTSHCCWKNDKEIISFCYVEGMGNNYYVFNDNSQTVTLLSNKIKSVDGHPSISLNKRWLLTDTYPDMSRMSSILLYDLHKDEIIKIGRFYQPLRYRKEMRIDLHPKWSLNGESIYFESGHKLRRSLYKLTLNLKFF